MAEARRNLTANYPASLPNLETVLPSFTVVTRQTSAPFPAGLAEKDQPIFQAADGSRASHLLTGDLKDFGPWMNRPDLTLLGPNRHIASFREAAADGQAAMKALLADAPQILSNPPSSFFVKWEFFRARPGMPGPNHVGWDEGCRSRNRRDIPRRFPNREGFR